MNPADSASNDLYLLIGSNQGDRAALLQQTTDLIHQHIGPVVCMSKLYETEPWGVFDDGATPVQNFYNQALRVQTPLAAHAALHEALAIEHLMGRKRPDGACGYTSRPIDIDLIFYNSAVVESPELTIPHPRMHLRKFVLLPLCEIAPDYIHPLLHKTLQQLTTECTDTCSCSCCA